MALLGVDIPSLDGHVQLRFLMTKKCTLEMMECVEDFVDSEVLEAVHQRTEKVKMARTAKVEEIMVEKRREMQAAAVAAAVAMAVAIEKRRPEAAAEVAAAVAMAVAIEKRRTTAIEKRNEREAEADAVAAAAAIEMRKERVIKNLLHDLVSRLECTSGNARN
jgi:hypothetical protein